MEKEEKGEDKEMEDSGENKEKSGEEENKDEVKIEESDNSSDEKGEDTVENSEIKDTEKVSSGKMNQENKQLKRIFFVIAIFALFFVGIFISINSAKSFDYQGVKFYVDKQTMVGKTIYRTSLPVNSGIKVTGGAVFADYSFYLRNDPRTLKNLPIEGELTLMKNVVMNFTGDFKCEGKGIIAVANLINVLEILDATIIKDETAICDSEGKYTFLQIQIGDETSIEQFGPSCYNLNINNCEVLEVTEKYIVELLTKVNKNIS